MRLAVLCYIFLLSLSASAVAQSQLVAVTEQSRINFTSALSIGSEIGIGDYVLQIVITDNVTRNAATQFVQFEIVE